MSFNKIITLHHGFMLEKMSCVARMNHSNLGKCDLKGQNASPTDMTTNYIILDNFT